jgi:hypothetical protein
MDPGIIFGFFDGFARLIESIWTAWFAVDFGIWLLVD